MYDIVELRKIEDGTECMKSYVSWTSNLPYTLPRWSFEGKSSEAGKS